MEEVAANIASSTDPGNAIADRIRLFMYPAVPVLRAIARGRKSALIQLFTLTLSSLPGLCLLTVLGETIWKPLAYPHSEHLFITETSGAVLEQIEKAGDPRTVATAVQCSALFALGQAPLITASGEIQRLRFSVVSKTFFGTLEPHFLLGSAPAAGQVADFPGRPLIVSERLWRATFGASRGVLGQHVTLNGLPAVIAGVVPDSSILVPGVDAWLIRQRWEDGVINGVISYKGLIRLQQGSSRFVAEQQLAAAAGTRAGARPDTVSLLPLLDYRFKDQRLAVKTAAYVAGALFLIGLVNSISVYCSELLRSQRDLALKTAMGSTSGQLLRDLIIRQQVYGVASWVVAGILCPCFAASVAGLEGLDQGGFSHRLPTLIAIGLGLLVFLATGTLIAVAQTWIIRQVNVASLLQEGSITIAGTKRGRLVQNLMLLVQVGVSTALLVAGGHVIRSYWTQAHADLGMSLTDVYIFETQLPSGPFTAARRSATLSQFMAGLGARLPASHIGAVNYLPLDPKQSILLGVSRRDQAPADAVMASYRAVLGDYFGALSIPMLRGRSFGVMDEGPNVPCRVVISAALAHQLGFAGDPIGSNLRIAAFKDGCEVIGVSADTRYLGADEAPLPEFFVNYTSTPSPFMTVIVKSTRSDEGLLATARTAAQASAANLSVAPPSTMQQLLDAHLRSRLDRSLVVACVASLALILTQLGLYGLIVRTVLSQAPRIAIELALGAAGLTVVRNTLRGPLASVVAAIVAGVVTARVLADRFILVEGDADDFGLVALAAAAIIVLLSIAGCLIAVGGVLRREPMQVLRWSGLS